MSRVRPEDMTDAELVAAIAIFDLASARLSPKPTLCVKINPRVGGCR